MSFQTTDLPLGPPPFLHSAPSFFSVKNLEGSKSLYGATLFYGKYKWTNEWLLCRIRSCDIDGTFTLLWQDGFLQVGTRFDHIVACTAQLEAVLHTGLGLEEDQLKLTIMDTLYDVPLLRFLLDLLQQVLCLLFGWKYIHRSHLKHDVFTIGNSNSASQQANMSYMGTPQPPFHAQSYMYKGLDVWEAAKQGNLEVCLAIIDQGHATPNDIERLTNYEAKVFDADTISNDLLQSPISSKTAISLQGRTPLYWACFGGHVELVRELLARGGRDSDGAAYLAITTREVANDNVDLLFDPDTNTFSDFVDYNNNDSSKNGKNSFLKVSSFRSDTNSQDAVLIRAMLLAAKTSSDRRMKSIIRRLPHQIYQSTVVAASKTNSSASAKSIAVSTTNKIISEEMSSFDSNRSNSSSISEATICKSSTNLNTIRSDDMSYPSLSNECVVCLEKAANAFPVPCGHVACCFGCLKKVERQKNGCCPNCRSSIAAVLPLHSVVLDKTRTDHISGQYK